MLCTSRPSQAQAIGARKRFVFHVSVNPLKGDDIQALAHNPKGGTAWQVNQALSYHPYKDQQGNQPTKGYLQQAPYSFRTVAKALAYINLNFRTNNSSVNPTVGELPWKKPKQQTSDPQLWIDYIVIQCLPGIYGPKKDKTGTLVPIDQKSGLPYNDEIFPLGIPDKVSIQGASALDTIFDARERQTWIFDFSSTAGPGVITHEYSFLDSVTIRGARCSAAKPFPNGAGVHIHGESNVYCVISNCFITDNWVGISIDNDEDIEHFRHSPIIVNNTIAWNRVGIWSGDSAPTQNKIGYAFPRVFNNIMDSGDPYGHFGLVNSVATAPFWGLDPTDMRIQNTVPNDFNAFETARAQAVHQIGGYSLPHWPSTASRTGPSAQYSARVDIQPYTHAGQMLPRGSLYINDIFRNSQGWDRSPHDFRLAPMYSFDQNPPTSAQSLNPLVNQGIDTFSFGSLQFSNLAPAINIPPGLPGPGPQSSGAAADYASFHCWDWDTDAYGNPRIVARPGFSAGAFGNCDFGADELDKLTMAGYIDRTRIFSQCIPDGSGVAGQYLPIAPHVEVYFFNLPGSYSRPLYTQWTGRNYLWWDYTQSTVALPNPVGNYTKGLSGSNRWKQVVQKSWEDFMRSLECDASPHLLPDYHPAWGTWQNMWGVVPAQAFNDIFASNPWVQHNQKESMWADNRWLYYDTTIYAVLEGTSNPPGSWLWLTGWGYLGPGPYGIFGPFGYTGTTQYVIPSTPAWGYGDSTAGGPDIIPNSNWYGVRYCNEVDIWLSTATNMQTFLGVNGTCILPPTKTTNGKAPQVKLVRSPGSKELDALRASVAPEIARRIKLGGKKKPDPKKK